MIRSSCIVTTVLLVAACNTDTLEIDFREISKMTSSDPFVETMVESQFFNIDSKRDTVVMGTEGTVIVIPEGAFVHHDGRVVTGGVELELAEAYRLEDMLRSGLTTTSDGKPLITDGMVYVNARSGKEQLAINPENPPYMEMPTLKRLPGMMIYDGMRDAEGNMNWVNPVKVETYLQPVDLDNLDFLPPGFAKRVEEALPFRGHRQMSAALSDSLYHTMSPEEITGEITEVNEVLEPAFSGSDSVYYPNTKWKLTFEKKREKEYDVVVSAIIPEGFSLVAGWQDEMHEPLQLELMDSPGVEAIGEWQKPKSKRLTRPLGEVTEDYDGPVSFRHRVRVDNEHVVVKVGSKSFLHDSKGMLVAGNTVLNERISAEGCGISPASLKSIRHPQYQQTLISTREFEQRMPLIHRSCKNEILELYVNNLDRNMWEIDSMAMTMVEDKEVKEGFERFRQLRQTRVKDGDKKAGMLRHFYKKQLKAIEIEVQAMRDKAEEKQQAENKEVKQAVRAYQDVLEKREHYRMETYGYVMTSLGWKNVDIGIAPKDRAEYKIELMAAVEGIDRAYAYLVFENIKSIHRLRSVGNHRFLAGNQGQVETPKEKAARIIYVGYKGDQLYFAEKQFTSGQDFTFEMEPQVTTAETFTAYLNILDGYRPENSIAEDLRHAERLYMLEKRQEKRRHERILLRDLQRIAFPCCVDKPDGNILFAKHCSACHFPDRKMIGPALKGLTQKMPMSWIVAFTQNSMELIKSGDAEALRTFNEHNMSVMPPMQLTEAEVKGIFEWIDVYEAE